MRRRSSKSCWRRRLLQPFSIVLLRLERRSTFPTSSTLKSFRFFAGIVRPGRSLPAAQRRLWPTISISQWFATPIDVLAVRIWELRENLTAYDAAYVALAEALSAPLVTRDRKLATAPGHRALIEVV